MTRATLMCGHCGGDAVYARGDGFFYEGDADRCNECQYPGHISVDDIDDEMRASWLTDDDAPGARCDQADCADCQSRRDR